MSEDTIPELLPCPVTGCGGEAELDREARSGFFSVRCLRCWLRTGPHRVAPGATNEWNGIGSLRPEVERLREENAELRREVEWHRGKDLTNAIECIGL